MFLKASSTQAAFLPASLPHIPLLPACWQAATDSIFSCAIHIKEGLRKQYMEKALKASKKHTRSSIAQAPTSPERHKYHQHLHWTTMSLQLSHKEASISSSSHERYEVEDLLLLIHHSLVLTGASSLKKSLDSSEWSTGCSIYVTTMCSEKILVCRGDARTIQMHYLRKQPGSLFLYVDGEALAIEHSSCVFLEVVNKQAQNFCFFTGSDRVWQ